VPPTLVGVPTLQFTRFPIVISTEWRRSITDPQPHFSVLRCGVAMAGTGINPRLSAQRRLEVFEVLIIERD
jgi:hypothetical protein